MKTTCLYAFRWDLSNFIKFSIISCCVSSWYRDIYPQFNHPDCAYGAPIWEVDDEGDVAMYAAPMSHGIPCVGYIVKEQSRPGRLKPDLIQPIINKISMH